MAPMTKRNAALVIFDEELPKKNQKWWQQFDVVVGPKGLASVIPIVNHTFINIEDYIDPGDVEEAARLTRDLSLIKTASGERVSKTFQYHGYELWWMHYDDFMYKFSLPYTQYEKLLGELKNYSTTFLYKPPFPDLFRRFFEAHDLEYGLEERFERHLPFGIVLQALVSIPFLFWAKFRKPQVMMWSNDLFNPPRDHDFRLAFIYDELRRKKIKFVEFIRSMESSQTVLQHALKRRRPVVYSFAIVKLLSHMINISRKNEGKKFVSSLSFGGMDSMERFWFLVSIHYLRNVSGEISAIKSLALILKFLRVKSAIITSASSRSFHEVIACKLENIKTVGILHGAASKNYNVYDFMPEFNGEKMLSLDKYGVWSEWWKAYYVENGKAYKPEQLHVSGPIRPLDNSFKPVYRPAVAGFQTKVLFVSEQLAAPLEVIPYLEALLLDKDLSVYLSFRPHRDGFENWLKEHRPDILNGFSEGRIIRSGINDAVSKCDVVVGTHSTAVLESLLQLKPFIFFRTQKWGDYYSLESYHFPTPIFASSPEQFVAYTKKSGETDLATIQELLVSFFGNPYENGSKWVVDEVVKSL